MYFRWRRQNQNRTGSDRTGSRIRSQKKKSFKEKKIQKNQIVYELVINKFKKCGKFKVTDNLFGGILQNCKNLPLDSPLLWLKKNISIYFSTNFSSSVIANFVFCLSKELMPNGVMTCQHFRPLVSFTREYIRGFSNYVMCSRRVCVSFVVHARRNVRRIC